MTPASELSRAASRLKDWVVEAALPYWAEHAQEASGGWVEHLHPNGQADREAVRRHRVQARQAYVYALATKRGWYEGRDEVRRTVDFMWDQGWGRDDQPGLIHRLSAEGGVVDARRDLYDHAFYLMALGWAQHVIGGQESRIESVRAFVDSLAHPRGGYAEGVPASLPRRQNPHMHYFEMCLALQGLGVAGDWRARADQLFGLFRAQIFDPRHKAVREYFDADWRWDGGTFEPGHACEWVWLLGQYQAVSGVDTARERAELYQNALITGGVWLYDETDHAWEPVRETSRLWVQTELIKAHLCQAEAGIAGSAGMAAAAIEGLLADWLEPRGTWRDQLGACGQTLSPTIPTSTFYHLICMADEAVRVSARV